MTPLLLAALVLSASPEAKVVGQPFAPGVTDAEVVGFSAEHRVAWVERPAHAPAVLRVVDLTNDRVVAELPWSGDAAVLTAQGIAPLAAGSAPSGDARLVSEPWEFRAVVDGRDLRVRRLDKAARRLEWKRVGALRSRDARALGWARSPFEARAALLVRDPQPRIVGVQLEAGFTEAALPVSASALYGEAQLASEVPPEMDECRDQEEATRALGFLAAALAKDRTLRDRARRDFPVLAQTLSFRLASGEVAPGRPGDLAAALDSATWAFTDASCGGGLYSATVSFGDGRYAVRCPQVRYLEGEEREEAEREEAAGDRRFRLEGTTLIFEDGSRWELSYEGGVATISGAGKSLIEEHFHCEPGA